MDWGMGARIAVAMVLAGPAYAQEPINGRWVIDPEGCKFDGDSSETASLYVTDKTLKWWVADCRIGKSYKVGSALYIQARCSNEGSRHAIAVVKDMRRCK